MKNAKTPYRIFRFSRGGWVAKHTFAQVNAWDPHSVEILIAGRRNWLGRPAVEYAIHGRAPFEALERLKKNLKVTA